MHIITMADMVITAIRPSFITRTISTTIIGQGTLRIPSMITCVAVIITGTTGRLHGPLHQIGHLADHRPVHVNLREHLTGQLPVLVKLVADLTGRPHHRLHVRQDPHAKRQGCRHLTGSRAFLHNHPEVQMEHLVIVAVAELPEEAAASVVAEAHREEAVLAEEVAQEAAVAEDGNQSSYQPKNQIISSRLKLCDLAFNVFYSSGISEALISLTTTYLPSLFSNKTI